MSLYLQELRILETLPFSKNVVQFHGSYIQDDNILLVLEFMKVNPDSTVGLSYVVEYALPCCHHRTVHLLLLLLLLWTCFTFCRERLMY